jgi:hypothetical protein
VNLNRSLHLHLIEEQAIEQFPSFLLSDKYIFGLSIGLLHDLNLLTPLDQIRLIDTKLVYLFGRSSATISESLKCLGRDS